MNCCRLRCLAEACSANPTTVSGTKFLGSTGHLPTAVELGITRRTKRRVLPLLPRREERGGERRGIFGRVSPLPNPLPARSSRGEGEDSLSPHRLIQWQRGSTAGLAHAAGGVFPSRRKGKR